jgi:hypothetical protein
MRLATAFLIAATPAISEITFEDVTSSLPIPHVYDGGWEHFVGGGVAVFDCNNDSLLDIFASGGANQSNLFINASRDGILAFELGQTTDLTGVTGAYPIDLEGDGLMDLVILRVGRNILLKGEGNCNFRRANEEFNFDGGDRWTTAFSATWEGDATLPSLAFGNYVNRADPDGPFEACDANELHRPKTGQYGTISLLEPGYCALSILFSDWGRQGTPDLRFSNDRHYYVRGGSEQMLRLKDLTFLEERDGWKQISIWGMGIASRDISGDKRPDVMLTSMGDQLLMLSNQNGFDAAPFSIGTYSASPFTGGDGRPSTGWHTEIEDVNNDGRLDIFIAKGNVDQMPSNATVDPNNLLIQNSDGTFSETALTANVADTERSRGASLSDFDNDGLLDLVVVNRRSEMRLYRNTTSAAGNWIGITLKQASPNIRAIGSWINVDGKGDFDAIHEVTIGGGHAGGKMTPTHFGLGDISMAGIRVTWPDGVTSDRLQVPVNQNVTLQRGPDGTLKIVPN